MHPHTTESTTARPSRLKDHHLIHSNQHHIFAHIQTQVVVPFFVKGVDDRDKHLSRTIVGKVDVVLFEGWRVGCRHPNFLCFSKWVDTMLHLKVDFDTINQLKKECVERDIAATKFDMYEKHGGYQHVFKVHYSGNYHNLIKHVEGWSDYVLEKDDSHHFTRFDRSPGKWASFQKSVKIEHTVAVVLGASQVGMSASYHLMQKGIPHIIIEKDSEVGSSWRDHRWDSFRLVTENSLCNLPDFPCERVGADPRGFMPRDDIVKYLKAFQTECKIPVRFNTAGEVGWVGSSGRLLLASPTARCGAIDGRTTAMIEHAYAARAAPVTHRDVTAQL